MNLGIVTSFYNGYDQFLPRWARSVSRMRPKPAYVTMYASGPYDPVHKSIAKGLLTHAGIRHIFIETRDHQGMGYARNHAVRNCHTEWIMYLDVDDTVLPNALAIAERYADKADVICTGLRIVGERKHRTLIYADTTRELILAGKHGSSSHSIYKRAFWVKAPYIETNDYIEQPFWLGLAQAGATFIGTKAACTVYHARKDGHNLSMTSEQKDEARRQFERFVREGVHRGQMLL